MRRVRYSARALRDLNAIFRFIARDNPMAARRVLLELYDACDGLEHFPNRGRPGRQRGTRELTTVWPYVIVYEVVAENSVKISAVHHGAQLA